MSKKMCALQAGKWPYAIYVMLPNIFFKLITILASKLSYTGCSMLNFLLGMLEALNTKSTLFALPALILFGVPLYYL
jgi:hypothetical protein